MPSLRNYWESGFRALHIEENIGNTFADFAPYAGADEQRIVVTRQSSFSTKARTSAATTASTSIPLGPASYIGTSTGVIVEENGDFTVQARDANAGCITFSTTGHLQLDAALRVPLPPPSLRAPAMTTREKKEEGKGNASVKQSATETSMKTPQLRFSDFTRPMTSQSPRLPHKAADDKPVKNADALSGPLGQLEIDVSLPDWDANRQSLGARVGPAAVRLTRTFNAAATAIATEAEATQLQNSGSLSDEDELSRIMRLKRARRYQHTIDAAFCIPFGSGGGDRSTASTTAGREKTEEAKRVSRTSHGDQIVLRAAPWALTCGLQFPLDLGDTLIGISLQNDRATSVSLPYPGVQWAVPPSTSSTSFTQVGEQTEASTTQAANVACVPFLLYSNDSLQSASRGDASTPISASGTRQPFYVTVPYYTFRFLLVQTLASHTLVRETSPLSSPQRNESGSTSLNASEMTRLASSYDWRRLPTLVGVNIGIDRERLRLSAASIMHDGNMDLEVAGVLDMTPWTPRIPTLVKVGYNNVGRFAAGITSLFYETVSTTLGVHIARGEQAKFGIEVYF